MKKKAVLAVVLAILGTLLVGLPLLMPVAFAAFKFIRSGRFMFDFLIPAEIFPVPLLGGLLLLGAALWTRLQRKVIGWGLVGSVALLLGGIGLAAVTGLASGDAEMGGWQGALVIAAFALFWAALIVLGVGGVLLTLNLIQTGRKPA